MKAVLNSLRRFSLTGLVVLVALWAGNKLWDYYMNEPWTRDGHVRADVVPVAPDVSGFVTEVLVKDNQQVRRGDVLFRIDRARYEIALKQAEAVLLGKRAKLDEANADLARYSALTPGLVVSRQRMDQVVATQGSAQAALDQAVADLGLAKLNLERSEVRASVSGVITNMELRPGAYLTPGKGVMALLDSETLHVQGYFEETKLSRIHLRRCRQCAAAGQQPYAARNGGKHRGRYRGSRSQRRRNPACQRQPDFQLGAAGAARSGPDRARPSAANSLRGPPRPSRCSDRCRRAKRSQNNLRRHPEGRALARRLEGWPHTSL